MVLSGAIAFLIMVAVSNNFKLNLEAIGITLGAVVSLTILLGLVVAFANRIAQLEIKLQYLKQGLVEHSNLEGHKIITEKLSHTIEQLNHAQKTLEIHIQDYVNRKDMIQYMIGQLDQKVDHKFGRLYASMRDVEKFLQQSQNFRIREYLDESKQ